MGLILFSIFSACCFAGALVWISVKFGPKVKATAVKSSSYECGLIPAVETNSFSEIPVRFYRLAILFILFDIEIIFLYPFAINYRNFLQTGEGIYYFLAFGLFLGVFALGLWWEIRSLALKWS